jgi:hypothetical protein
MMDYKITEVPEHIFNNLNAWKSIWTERCNLIDKFEPGTYSRHILLILTDLSEEIESNKENFSENKYGKNFFKTHIQKYINSLNQEFNHNKSIQEKWASGISQELFFICDILSSERCKSCLSDILTSIECIENTINSHKNFAMTIDLLLEELSKNELDCQVIIFLTDTIILLFLNRGYSASSINDYIDLLALPT